MAGLVEMASAIMGGAQRRLEIAAANVSNGATPGYKRVSPVRSSSSPYAQAADRVRVGMDQGKLRATGRPLDLAIAGEGLFQVRAGDRLLYTRQGQFSVDADGAVVSAQGHPLQQAGGGDLIVGAGAVVVDPDGTVTEDGRPVGRIALFRTTDAANLSPVNGTLFALTDAEEVDAPQLRQAMLEASTVELGTEMVSMMAALREADAGAKLVQTYDDLIGRAITTFGGTGR